MKKLLSYLKPAPSNLANWEISQKKNKLSTFGTKNTLFGYFWAWKNDCHIQNQHPQICLIGNFHKKKSKFGTKDALFGYFWARVFTNYCHIWNQHPRISLMAKFCKKAKISKFGTKNALFEYFLTRIWKSYYHIWNQHPRISLIAKFRKKQKCLNLGPKIPYLGTFGLELEKTIVIFKISTLEFF